ncbi:MAG TPA: xanthine dehydrogenase family protein molybdopterin-binding subunit [Reyranella sp.]|nr:xanthine dehydrogenase family protein molybdopterin-binding subunit [Reyranella sp.]
MPDHDHKHPWAPRIEDAALLRGHGRFMDDVHAPNEAAVVFLRSPHAHAWLRSIDTTKAKALPGVLAVLTAKDIAAGGAGTISHPLAQIGRGGKAVIAPPRPALADDRAMHVGHPVVLIVAETAELAQDALELVEIDYETLPAVIGVRDTIADGAPQLWAEAPGNICLDWPGPHPKPDENRAAVDRIFEAAAHVAKVTAVNQRIAVATMETRGATASYDAAADKYLLRCPSQGVHMLRSQIAASLKVPPEKIRLLTGDVGGAFGMKTAAYPEYVAMLVAAKIVGRPVHWISSRIESFMSDNQARDTVTDAEVAMDANGKFLALRVSAVAAVGAFLSSHGATIASNNFARCFPAMYDVPHVAVDVRCVFTNTVQLGPYRGAGRPEANYALELLVEEAARVTGIDAVTLRRRNLIAPAQIPYAGAVGTKYDSGEFEAVLDKSLAAADVAGFAQRRARSEQQGKLRGLGLSCFLEHAGGVVGDEAGVSFPGEGTLFVSLGMQASGQGHASLYRRMAAAELGIDETRIVVRQGDTDYGIAGYAAVASRSTTAVGSALVRTIEVMLEKGRQLASHQLEASEADIEYVAGVFGVRGTDRRVSLFEVAEQARKNGESLDTKARAEVPQTYPNGCHIAEVEIDPETGVTTLASYVAVDDCGVILDHVLVEGQIHGGIAQGVGQALWEDVAFDRESGQVLGGSFMDYTMPRADDLPMFVTEPHPVPATTNPLGAKGTGEAGTTGALAAVMLAIADAIPNGAGIGMDMPATAEKVWRACRTGRKG